MRIYTLLRDLWEIPGISGRHEWDAHGVSRTMVWKRMLMGETNDRTRSISSPTRSYQTDPRVLADPPEYALHSRL